MSKYPPIVGSLVLRRDSGIHSMQRISVGKCLKRLVSGIETCIACSMGARNSGARDAPMERAKHIEKMVSSEVHRNARKILTGVFESACASMFSHIASYYMR